MLCANNKAYARSLLGRKAHPLPSKGAEENKRDEKEQERRAAFSFIRLSKPRD